MSEHDEDQGKWVGSFILSVIVGALLMLGIGGGLWTMQASQARMRAEQALHEAERARLEAEMAARKEAERARLEAERAAHERAKAAKGPAGAKDGK
jgi:hypothetical protein